MWASFCSCQLQRSPLTQYRLESPLAGARPRQFRFSNISNWTARIWSHQYVHSTLWEYYHLCLYQILKLNSHQIKNIGINESTSLFFWYSMKRVGVCYTWHDIIIRKLRSKTIHDPQNVSLDWHIPLFRTEPPTWHQCQNLHRLPSWPARFELGRLKIKRITIVVPHCSSGS